MKSNIVDIVGRAEQNDCILPDKKKKKKKKTKKADDPINII